MQTLRVADEPGFVLRTMAWQETSLLVEAFTARHGRIGLVARGARRPRSGLRAVLQPFVPLQLRFSRRGELATLSGAEASAPPAMLAGDALFAGWYLNELLLRTLARDDPHSELFAAYAAALRGLAEGAIQPAVRCFEKALLDAIGYGLQIPPDLKPDQHYQYDWRTGPVPAAPGEATVRGATLLALAAGRIREPDQLREARRLLREALARVTGARELESLRALRQMRRLTP